ncbi:fatty acid-binding protein, liver-like [Acanthaster planci]|uniref:Fatty acid-binding protein, liver-like n=1 Tax=Acanthaster planci TaxID=133434 RepID=A0A8B7Y774_ACAPL|nr:fatty acid-binding protein, liver-like [Acanthaster planci]
MANEAELLKFAGKWKLEKSENFDEYLRKMDVMLPMRAAAKVMTPTCEIAVEGNNFVIKMNVPVITLHVQKFKINDSFEDMLPNGNKQLTQVSWEDGKIVLREVDKSDPPHVVTREVNENGTEMIMTCIKGDIVCKRHYRKM